MQNSANVPKPVDDEIVVPNGTGAEAFVNVEDIASVAAATLADPERHAGRAFAPTGPESLTLHEAAQIISTAVGRTIVYRDTDRDEWVDAMVCSGVPAEYGEVLRTLTGHVPRLRLPAQRRRSRVPARRRQLRRLSPQDRSGVEVDVAS
jgi:uncharacterized protein YbjT (DUF2867 family)